jgi:multidrug efflux pump
MAAVEAVAKKQSGTGHAWSGMSYQERLSGGQAPLLFALSILVVFLCLAALYESWSVPFPVMLVIPLGVLGAVIAATLRGLSHDIYFQVGRLATIGLSAKNAILIIEFAEAALRRGVHQSVFMRAAKAGSGPVSGALPVIIWPSRPESTSRCDASNMRSR